ncbi:MAG: hypothetical protein A2887_06055 [Alphaproteobacteria bacterium RIFCSPLOWO2_01_FULL_40_26]|nr:MAG: hypothetical protein A3D15_04365 [Alphaproteobacteria bacterium RIFCSPHIGHO2_02_FULL_40_34]OFW85410.1 MAG: hypothetical protein A2794_05265 [Alphaproteobacteria bacterium RIFCSPHIGHO2_01_FULL_40_8]OFW94117.1 MAG: hypothetical protein A2887_06055 [Alphaproteobacteria bacterium RIFCSPLOWO2_01_FULL_40_26]OFX09702.1 MAG: hypothetical protein A3H30_06680 [Alphaproteobacteria bacterium RIFCSPLOWO2_02_FULL_40_19]OFX11382.1 MAG: hypothetical protein A3G22_06255 [Alphaproteobacteria bacterium RI
MKSQNSPVEVLHVISKKISCDGGKESGKGISKHPLVYLNMGEKDFVICPYCSKYFTIRNQSSSSKK